ncbi:CcdB family protein [Azospirillum thermophilum]|uniref:Toxin CcdB n=1 Tax=Azospirillum thermophilum TaxID=2202148 RepID=A0A2S2CM78_9PROT|nr:CcdB family protein [Azospirillum thermophilum]AWK85615.1 plasmid maintenance protein CcdB [Azospirillum thermophilum]
MARFDVHRRLDGAGYLLDLQADILRDLNTRFVAPSLPLGEAPRPAAPLNPAFMPPGTPSAGAARRGRPAPRRG